MYLFLKILKFFTFLVLSYILLIISKDIDVEQFLKDLNFFSIKFKNINSIFFIISLAVVGTTFVVKQILNPFIEIFVEHYFKFSFYIVINILSISAIFIVLRVYGYSRLYLMIYLFLASLSFEIYERLEYKLL